jgi:hypothetical protein
MRLPNPLIPEPGMSDPHALVLDDVCYLFTGYDIGVGLSDWVMPEWRIFRSEDLQQWTQVGVISPADNYMGSGNTSCWAGDIVQRNGRFYWYFSNGNQDCGVMVAERPEGPYHDALGKPLVDSFDPTVFVDDDGTSYLVYGAHEYNIARLKENMIELAETPRPIPFADRGDFPSMDKNSLHKQANLYYLSCSGHYATSHSPYGPYIYRGTVGSGWQLESPYAHGDFFVWNGSWFHVWCRYRDRRIDRIRDCFIAPVHYQPDGSMHDDLTQLPQDQQGRI